MADPKFENLPGIAYDQPDVYETPDNPDASTSDYYEEEPENESIERLHISPSDAFNRFRGAALEGSVDFSDRIGRRQCRGYDARSGEFELVGTGEKETPVQKCRRLQCEMNELMDEIAALQVDRKIAQEEKESYDAVATIISTAKRVLDSLRLEQVLGKEQVPTAADKEVKSLIGQVEEYKKSGVLTAIPPPGSDLAASARIAKLEHRLHQLEQAVGAQPEKLSRLSTTTNTTNVLEAVRQLSTKAALLQPAQLDAIETRLGTLTSKMDAIAEKSSGSTEDAKRDQKVCELYEIAKRTEPVAEILPDIIERMQALEALHKYAMNFAKIIAEIEQKQTNITTSLVNNKELLHSVQETFAQNLETINKEVAKVDERVKAIVNKK
ncbi:dynactin subunit 2-like [Teleopsis dalmanni]|uniref:dynactin subunit 2-like n=1 Tax=Teleopsis dalmanni TaxID=139649 RepID=UPI0018CE2418|nr:dynactin subunit 2-like [Teleopsis dalmanni]XP_037953207.1 dynactin subunit 2-like [Teleopsis dalmanni]XP_037953287.1 dynactin subunit 2-like [Teleopsis dalmanni]